MWIGIAGAIWVLGILVAILGRVVSREHTNHDAFLSVQKIQAVGDATSTLVTETTRGLRATP
jgi:predicted anti-sigma-YlaC factor YlaD